MRRRNPRSAGVGLRLPHLAEVAATRPSAAWFEVHPENFLANPHAFELLQDIARDYPISVHTVGVSIGSAGGIDRNHLQRVRRLLDALDPFLVSGHLAWSTHAGEYLNDLLPLPLTEEALDAICRNVDRMQEALRRRVLVENPSTYLDFAPSRIPEPEFIAQIVRRTGCGLLLDVNNIHVSAHNRGFDAEAYLAGLPAEAVGEIHIAGHATRACDGAPVLIDDHGSAAIEPVWRLLRAALSRTGPVPVLVEWDTEIPELPVLLAEAHKAEACLQTVATARAAHAA